jgi:glycine/D-amino acid oxidase-like deaminating enzyme
MQADLIIVGAGISGLRCGIEVLKKHPTQKVVILEKYNYLGGRVVSYAAEVGSKTYHWENGAGRISDSHKKVHGLLKQYKLETIPLSHTQLWIQKAGDEPQENSFEDTLNLLLPMFERLDPEVLAKHTLLELSTQLLGANRAKTLFEAFPYRAEVETLRGDLAIQSFQNEMAPHKGFTVVKTGLSSLIHGMVNDFKKRGGFIFAKQDVQDLQRSASKTLVISKTPHGKVIWEAPKVILALHADALRSIPAFKDAPFLKHLKMEPLLRCYAVFDKPCLKGIERTVTAEPLRYFIPMTENVAMISYTESQDAKNLMEMTEGVLRHFLTNQLRDLYPGHDIPDPIYFKTHPWSSGCTYWLPGSYRPSEESKKAHYPFPDRFPGVYCCGESLSLRQAWMEGALESADFLVEQFFV